MRTMPDMTETEVTHYYDLHTDTGYIYVRPRPTQAIIDEVMAVISAYLGVDPAVNERGEEDVFEMSLKTGDLEVIAKIGGVAVTTIATLEHEYVTSRSYAE
jgi:hypothetical protein